MTIRKQLGHLVKTKDSLGLRHLVVVELKSLIKLLKKRSIWGIGIYR